MSYARLVGDADHPQAKREQFSDEIVFLVIERGTTKVTDRGGVIDGRTIFLVHEGALARFPNAVRYHVHCAIQWNLCPLFRARCAIFHLRLAPIVCEQLIRSRAFWTKIPLTNRALGIAFD